MHAAHDPALCEQGVGPLLDRIDIHIEVPAVQYKELRGGGSAEGSAEIRERVLAAREVQHARFEAVAERTHAAVGTEASRAVYANAQMSTQQIRLYCELSTRGGADAGARDAAAGPERAGP